MAKFGEVFSTTWKVLVALLLISLGVIVISFMIGVIGRSTQSASSRDMTIWYRMADEKHTSMPLSRWNKLVAAAIKQHCPWNGMTKDEVEKAIGKPLSLSDNGSSWHYERTAQEEDCTKYVGDKCSVQTVHQTADFFFSPNGYLVAPSQSDTGGWLYKNCFSGTFYDSYGSY